MGNNNNLYESWQYRPFCDTDEYPHRTCGESSIRMVFTV